MKHIKTCNLHTLLFTDDQVITAQNEDELQRAVEDLQLYVL
jgi:hypothetical protein